MKEFRITIDVTMSGDIYIDAETKEEAIKKAKDKYFNAGDLRDFHYMRTEIVDCKEDAC